MNRKTPLLKNVLPGVGLLIALLLAMFSAQAAETATSLQQDWDFVNFTEKDNKQKLQKLEELVERARSAAEREPGNAEILVWKGVILSTYAGEKGGLGALSLVKEAKAAFEQALLIDDAVLNGAAHTSLGSLYYQVPGWPLSFGDDSKAEKHLQAGLKIAPQNIDALYFYGDFLARNNRLDEAKSYMKKAM
ncbi:MAG: hypothetical protein KDI30_01015, partial [Pseudomonadales bacterium]|nr:hypothetical protein [Pseudomonadales bacterium]